MMYTSSILATKTEKYLYGKRENKKGKEKLNKKERNVRDTIAFMVGINKK